jgi:hypothetical protein
MHRHRQTHRHTDTDTQTHRHKYTNTKTKTDYYKTFAYYITSIAVGTKMYMYIDNIDNIVDYYNCLCDRKFVMM